MCYPMIVPHKLEGEEEILDDQGNKISDVNGFWSWAYSNVIDNAERGVLAEYIVACALGISDEVRMNWENYDLLSPEGIKVEVKASGYIQSWRQKKLSSLEFGIQPTLGWNRQTNAFSDEKIRQADVYVFCVHKQTDQNSVNPLDIGQWDFYLLPTTTLNRKAGIQKKASLSSLLKMGAEKCEFHNIHKRIVVLINSTRKK